MDFSKSFLLSIFFIFSFSISNGEEIYHNAFGDEMDMPVIFLHGGPGYNSATFEFTTAQELAANGYYVIVYDRRGEGRSQAEASYTFSQSVEDILYLYQEYSLDRAILIGHSFGGMVGLKFMEAYPEKCHSLVLVGAPIDLQESFTTIIENAGSIYEKKNDQQNLAYLNQLKNMDKSSLNYAVYCFAHAMQTGAYSTEIKTEEAESIAKEALSNPEYAKYAKSMTQAPTMGFWSNENYTTINLKPTLVKLIEGNNRLYGLYGKEDGLYSTGQIEELASLLGKDNLEYIEGASHSVFIDQQGKFIEVFKTFTESN